MYNIRLIPLNPTLHRAYTTALFDSHDGCGDIPADVLAKARALVERRSMEPDDKEIDRIDADIVETLWWYVLRPDEIARAVMWHHGWSIDSALTFQQASIVLAAMGEAGYPITGNGAPRFDFRPQPTRGDERDRILWAAARYWAATVRDGRHVYVSLGDCRGYLPRPVQCDEPGSIDPCQQAALTLGPASDRASHDYMRRHTRLLLLVQDARPLS